MDWDQVEVAHTHPHCLEFRQRQQMARDWDQVEVAHTPPHCLEFRQREQMARYWDQVEVAHFVKVAHADLDCRIHLLVHLLLQL